MRRFLLWVGPVLFAAAVIAACASRCHAAPTGTTGSSGPTGLQALPSGVPIVPGTITSTGQPIRIGESIPNTFDPSLAGLDRPVGSVVTSRDGNKGWTKFGTAKTAWTPIAQGTTSSRLVLYQDGMTQVPVGIFSTLARDNGDVGALVTEASGPCVTFPNTATGNGMIFAQPNAPSVRFGGGTYDLASSFKFKDALPDGTNDFSDRWGFVTALGATPQGAFIRVLQSQFSGRFACIGSDGVAGAANEVAVDMGVAPTLYNKFAWSVTVDSSFLETCTITPEGGATIVATNRGRVPRVLLDLAAVSKTKTAGAAARTNCVYAVSGGFTAEHKAVSVMAIGDSNTAGQASCLTVVAGPNTQPGDAWRYQAFLTLLNTYGIRTTWVGSQNHANALTAHTYDYGNYDEGVGGNRIDQMITQGGGVSNSIDREQPRVVVINGGTINANQGPATTANVAGDLAVLYQTARVHAPKAWIVIVDPITSTDPTTVANLPSVYTQINTVFNHIRAGSGTDSGGTAGNSVTWTTPDTRNFHVTTTQAFDTSLLSDAFHPGCAGYDVMGTEVLTGGLIAAVQAAAP